ncbi:hypothetical protein ACSU1N_03715 [Thermogladius sp. 4427co]|uniref:hypothetical protein n=1 Tax=Thermogladius sp. 4427co TaxID=3450718 RepID=UPI003F791DF4
MEGSGISPEGCKKNSVDELVEKMLRMKPDMEKVKEIVKEINIIIPGSENGEGENNTVAGEGGAGEAGGGEQA